MTMQNLGISGSVRVAEMFRDAVGGVDSLDVLVVGDSNSLFASEAAIPSAGWTDGLQYGLYTNGAPIYATPIFPCGLDSTTQSAGWRCQWQNYTAGSYAGIGDAGITFDGETGAILLSGNSDGPSQITNAFKMSNAFGPASALGGASRMDYAYYGDPSPRFWDYLASTYVPATNPMGVSSAFHYRVVHGVFLSGGGHFHQHQSDDGGATETSQQISCSGTANGIATAILDIAASGSRTSGMRCAWGGKFAANRSSGSAVVGKAAFLLQSVTKQATKGAAVSCMCWYGGATATQIGAGATGVLVGTWQTWLREARARQIASGGTGRVVIMFHAGANADTGLPYSWGAAFEQMRNIALEAWSNLGYPATDVGFIAMVSHVKDSNDTLSSIRTYVNATYEDSTDTLVVDLGQIAPYSLMSAQAWYDNTGGSGGSATPDVHLYGGGYEAVGSLIVSRILAYQDGGLVDLETVKQSLKIEYDDDDDELERLIHAAESLFERRTGRYFTNAARTMKLRRWQKSLFLHYPFNSVTSVSYTAPDGTLTTMPSSDYWIDDTEELSVIEFLKSPAIKDGTAISVAYLAGHNDPPDEAVQAIIALVGHWYNNPEASQPVSLSTVPMSLEFIMDSLSTRGPFR